MEEKIDKSLLGKGGTKEKYVRQWFVTRFGDFGSVTKDTLPNSNTRVQDIMQAFKGDTDGYDIGYSSFKSVWQRILEELGFIEVTVISTDTPIGSVTSAIVSSNKSIDIAKDIVKIEDLEFPEFKRYMSGKPVDMLFSDFETGGGAYGGCVYITIGESGVGKTTVLLDYLQALKVNAKFGPEHGAAMAEYYDGPLTKYLEDKANGKKPKKPAKPEVRLPDMLYISSEMTRNDILFAYKKQPAIGKVNTLLLMDYVDGGLDEALSQAFHKGYDIIVFDSYQDSIVKMIDLLGWKSRRAETFLINMMVSASEEKGTTVFAIQHVTKGGDYAGGTYLKHATTGMLEMKFTEDGRRYLMFTKNRRGGSMVKKKMFFTQNKEDGSIIYDMDQFKDEEMVKEFADINDNKMKELSEDFDKQFMTGMNTMEDPSSIEDEETEDADVTEETVEEEKL